MLVKIKTIFSSIWTDICDTYKRCKVLLIAIAAAIVYFEWEKIKTAFLVYSAQKQVKNDKKEDEVLAKTEDTESKQADALVQQSKQENVNDDWYKK